MPMVYPESLEPPQTPSHRGHVLRVLDDGSVGWGPAPHREVLMSNTVPSEPVTAANGDFLYSELVG